MRFALVAHDARKDDLVAWVDAHQSQLMHVCIVSTGTTGGRNKGPAPPSYRWTYQGPNPIENPG